MNLLASLLALLSLYLMAKRNVITWPVSMTSSVLFIFYFYPNNEKVLVALNVTYFIIGCFGWYKWSRK
jgi:nicotinamide mononucleotide transporter